MAKIAYDPVKDRFAALIRNSRILRTLFYKLLDLFFLRSWYIRRLVSKHTSKFEHRGRWQIFDAGCGFGQYDRFLLKQFRNVKVFSIDVKEDYLRDCRTYFNREIGAGSIQFEKQDLLEIEYEEKFDFTICIDVLEHIVEDEEVIARLARSLKPGGFFLMHSPSHYSEDDAEGEDSFVGEHARTGYSMEDITRKIKHAGLEPVDIQYTYGKPGHFSWVMLIKYPMLLLNKISLFALPILMIYYIVTLPFGLILMQLDTKIENERGTGIYALARKSA